MGDAEVPSAVPVSPSVSDTNLLDSVLLAEWEDRADQGLFRYDVTACPTKLVPGPYGFIAQCNEGRLSKKRPTEFRVDQVHVLTGPCLYIRVYCLSRLHQKSQYFSEVMQFCSGNDHAVFVHSLAHHTGAGNGAID